MVSVWTIDRTSLYSYSCEAVTHYLPYFIDCHLDPLLSADQWILGHTITAIELDIFPVFEAFTNCLKQWLAVFIDCCWWLPKVSKSSSCKHITSTHTFMLIIRTIQHNSHAWYPLPLLPIWTILCWHDYWCICRQLFQCQCVFLNLGFCFLPLPFLNSSIPSSEILTGFVLLYPSFIPGIILWQVAWEHSLGGLGPIL